MLSRLADAAETAPNKSVVVYVPGGALGEHWYPNEDLSSFPEMSQPYESVASECNFLRNMTQLNGGHGNMPRILNTDFAGDTFDVNIGRIISANHPFSYINLGVMSNGHGEITRNNGALVPFEDNPFNAFNRLFNASPGDNSPLTSVLDPHRNALTALQSKLGNYEKHRLDQHLTAIEETEQRLIALSGGLGGSCEETQTPAPFELSNATFTQQAKLQADIIALALQCNLTASVSLGFGNHQGEHSFPELNFKDNYHSSIHGGGGDNPTQTYPHYRELRAHVSSLSAYLIAALKDKGVLDSTIVCEVSDMGHGNQHGSENAPMIMAGGGGAIQRGVSNAGSSGFNQLNMLHTAAVALNAHQDPLYKGYASSVIPGVLT
ncbi:MAG: hypothetical protein COA42_21870 [Alteromonadaceae bacterium]|nr:MAG: hypothetical protein COA42_21870 [Alteromonadaceae bacterium]